MEIHTHNIITMVNQACTCNNAQNKTVGVTTINDSLSSQNLELIMLNLARSWSNKKNKMIRFTTINVG